MRVYVDRGGVRYGPFSLQQVNACLANGTLLPTDLAWQDGMAGWVPITQIPGVTMHGGSVATQVSSSQPAPKGNKKWILILVGIGLGWLVLVLALSKTREELYERILQLGLPLTFVSIYCSVIWCLKRRGKNLADGCVKVLESKGFVKLSTADKKIPYIENLSAIEEYCGSTAGTKSFQIQPRKQGTPWITNPEIILDHYYSCRKPLENAWLIVSDFDFSEYSSEGITPYQEATSRYHQTVAVFASNDFNYSWFKLKPRSLCDFGICFLGLGFLLDRTSLGLGSRFDRKYSLESSLGTTINTLFTAKTTELLLSSKGIVIEGAKNYILIYRMKKSVRAKDISDFTEEVTKIFKTLKLY